VVGIKKNLDLVLTKGDIIEYPWMEISLGLLFGVDNEYLMPESNSPSFIFEQPDINISSNIKIIFFIIYLFSLCLIFLHQCILYLS
jgi:hypothetical protein